MARRLPPRRAWAVTLEIALLVLVPFIGLALGLGLVLLVPRRASAERDDLLGEARAKRDERIRAARSQALEERAEAEASARQLLTAVEEAEQRLDRREERLESRLDNLMAREAATDVRESEVVKRAAAASAACEEQAASVERIRSLSPEAARATLLEQVAPSARETAVARAEGIQAEAEDAFRQARARPAALAVQRTSSDLVGEFALVPVPIPREEIKGRIIGREGRNIKAFEAMTGVELVIDDAPDVVTLSGFDPFRREVARLALLDLVEDGRIHPGRIEESVSRTRENLARQLHEDGVRAANSVGAGHLSPDLAELLGRLRLIRSGTEDLLKAAVRSAGLAAQLAAELKADPRVTRRAALLYDLGRAVGRDAGGSTEVITADVLTRAAESPAVVAAVKPPGDLYPTITPEQAAVWLARAAVDAGWAAREESPVRRVDAVERAAALVEGVAEARAFQVGTRVRLLLSAADAVDTVDRIQLAAAVIERIEVSLGPRVGLTVALLAGPTYRAVEDEGTSRRGTAAPGSNGESAPSPTAREPSGSTPGNGAGRLEAVRPRFRGRHGRRRG